MKSASLLARVGLKAVFVGLSLVTGNALAQTAVCSDMPGTGERIECTEDADSSEEIRLSLKGIDIDTTEDNAHGVSGDHEGSDKIFIDLQTGLDENGDLIRNIIDTMGEGASGVYGRHVGSGNIELGAQSARYHHDGSEFPGNREHNRLSAECAGYAGSPAGGCR